MPEPDDETPGAAMLRERLRGYGHAVEAQRRPVDVDAILGGAIALPRRRAAQRWTPAMVLATVAVVGLFWGAMARPTDDEQVSVGSSATHGPPGTARRDGSGVEERLQPQATFEPPFSEVDGPGTTVPGPTATPVPDPSASTTSTQPAAPPTFSHRSADGRFRIDINLSPPADPAAPCVPFVAIEGCMAYAERTFVGDQERGFAVNALRPLGADEVMRRESSGGSPPDWSMVYLVAPSVARVTFETPMLDGSRYRDEAIPAGGIVAFAFSFAPVGPKAPTTGTGSLWPLEQQMTATGYAADGTVLFTKVGY